ncbi:MAG: hypothetical protein ACLU8J_12020 [Acutalibacter sp.]
MRPWSQERTRQSWLPPSRRRWSTPLDKITVTQIVERAMPRQTFYATKDK